MKLHHYDSILKHYEPHQGKYKEFWGISGSFSIGHRCEFFNDPTKQQRFFGISMIFLKHIEGISK